MATVRHFGYFPWCPWPSRDAFLRWLGGGIIPEDLSIYDLAAVDSLRFTSLTAALAAYWRVKKWRVKGQTWFGIGSGMTEILNIDRTIERVETESDLICWNGTSEDKKLTNFTVNSFNQNIEFDFQFPGSPVFDIPPMIGPTLWFTTVFVGGYEEGAGPTLNTANTEDSVEFYIPLKFLNFQESITTRLNPVETPQEILDQGFLETYFTIEADEYWPYDPNDGGGPIYDKATGKQLRPFP